MDYVELHCHSNYSFQEGASFLEELLARAVELGYPALALTDHDNLCGAMEFSRIANSIDVQPITGAEITLSDGSHLTLLARTRRGYSNLCNLLTASRAGVDGDRRDPRLNPALLKEHARGLVLLTGCSKGRVPSLVVGGRPDDAEAELRSYVEWFGQDNVFIELQQNLVYGDTPRNRRLVRLARTAGVDVGRDQQRPLSRARAPSAPGRSRRHPAQQDPGGDAPGAAGQRQLLPQVGGGDGAALPRSSRGAAQHPPDSRALRLQPGNESWVPLSRLRRLPGRAYRPELPGAGLRGGGGPQVRVDNARSAGEARRGVPPDPQTRAGGLLLDLLRGDPDRPGGDDRPRPRGPRGPAGGASPGPRPRLVGRHARGLPDRAVAHRSPPVRPQPRPLHKRRDGKRARHRHRLPARYPGGDDQARAREVRMGEGRPDRRDSHLQDEGMHPRPGEGPRHSSRGRRQAGQGGSTPATQRA